LHIGFAARQRPYVLRVQEQQLETRRPALEHIPDRNPVNARALRRDLLYFVLPQPIAQPFQIFRERSETGRMGFYLLVTAHEPNAHRNRFLVYIQPRATAVQYLHACLLCREQRTLESTQDIPSRAHCLAAEATIRCAKHNCSKRPDHNHKRA
jgi:hypothetical protein